MKRILMPVTASFLLLIVLISGCTFPGGGQTGGGQGVIIENFEPDFSKVYAGETFKLQMRIRNTGSVDAYNVYPKLYNVKSSDDRYEVSCDETCGNGVNLLAPDPERGTTGESKTCIWNCKAPQNIPKGLSVTFSPNVRLYYLYETHTIKSINFVSQDELRSVYTQGKPLPSETISTTNGPVTLDVVVNGPIRYWEGESKIRFPINVNIVNNGGGVTCMDKNIYSIYFPSSPLNPVPDVSIDVLLGGCENNNFWNSVNFYFKSDSNSVKMYINGEPQTTKIIDLWKGQSATLTPEIEIPVPTDYSAGMVQKTLQFSLLYAYFNDASTSVEVVGRDNSAST